MKTLAEIKDIISVLPLLEMKWGVQNDFQDKNTGFIYWAKRPDQVISLAISNEVDVGYALHRWYNFQCSKWVESIFCDNGAVAYENEKDHDIDLTIDGVPFDIKVSIVSPSYQGNKDLSTRANKDNYINWLKQNASQEGRKHTANKIFVICDTMKEKCDFLRIDNKVTAFIEYFRNNIERYKGNEICDLIYIEKQKEKELDYEK